MPKRPFRLSKPSGPTHTPNSTPPASPSASPSSVSRQGTRSMMRGYLTCVILFSILVAVATTMKFDDATTKQFLRQIGTVVESMEKELEIKAKETRYAKYRNLYNYTPPTTAFYPNQIPAECGQAPDFEAFFQQDSTKHSRLAEDKFIYENFFKHRMNGIQGTYVELGAYNGVHEANTRFFDICLGWKGLLMEGNPLMYKEVVQSRTNAHRISYAPSCSAEYEAINKTVTFMLYPWANAGLKGFAKDYDDAHDQQTVEVPCGPITPVLQDIFEENSGINFFSLDVEGAESMVLQTLDFDKIHIDVMIIETANLHCPVDQPCQNRDTIRAIMKKANFHRYESIIPQSDLFVHPRSTFQLSSAFPKAVG